MNWFAALLPSIDKEKATVVKIKVKFYYMILYEDLKMRIQEIEKLAYLRLLTFRYTKISTHCHKQNSLDQTYQAKSRVKF